MKHRSPRYETILYASAFLLAIGLRFARLGDPALTDSEARLALDALQITQGLRPALSPHVAYTNLTAILFFIFGSTNFLARFWPALAGSALALVPALFREKIKPRPAIILAFFLAIDPAFVALARQAGTPILTITFSLLALGFWLRRQPRLAGAFLALTLLSGPALWAGLLGILLTWMIMQGITARPKDEENVHTDTGTQVNPSEEDAIRNEQLQTPAPQLATPNPALPKEHRDNESEVEGTFHSPLPISSRSEAEGTQYASILTSTLITLLLTSTLFLLAPQGLSAWLGSLPDYISGWTRFSGVPSGRMFLALGVYQPLAILFALVAIVRGWWNAGRRIIRLSLWMMVALLLVVFHPSRQPADLAWMLIPLWTLAAMEFARHVDLDRNDRLETAGVLAFTALLLGFAWMDLNALYYAALPSSQGILRIWLFFGSLLLLIVSVVLVGYGWSERIARVGAAWGTLLVLGLYTVGVAWGATGLRIPTGVDIWLTDAPVHQADLLSQTADEVSEWATGHADKLPVTVFGVDSPALLWTLRYHNPKIVLALDPATAPELVVTPVQQSLGLEAGYRGQDFNWRQTPIWDAFSSYNIRWVTYRELPVQGETIILWVREDLFIDSGSSQP